MPRRSCGGLKLGTLTPTPSPCIRERGISGPPGQTLRDLVGASEGAGGRGDPRKERGGVILIKRAIGAGVAGAAPGARAGIFQARKGQDGKAGDGRGVPL